LEIKPNRKSV